MERFIADNTLIDQRLTLLGQFYVMDDKKTIAQVVADCSKEWDDDLTITEYVRFELGEGIEKKTENFAEEVALQMKWDFRKQPLKVVSSNFSTSFI